mmetsp:Transcript_1594/g.5674  ORF Transcript_1594/g.5674 Transcript_1594/m.5674 type:complete len:215 (+) Transcript_1594:158-802(+)
MWAVLPGSSLEHERASEDEAIGWELDAPQPEPEAATRRHSAGATPRRQSTGGLLGEGGRRKDVRVRFCCYLCGDTSHTAAECPRAICIACLGVGHQYADCPSGRKPAVCGCCGRLGHVKRDCPWRAPPDLARVRCLVCGELGHTDCSSEGRGERPQRVSCFNCGRSGHDANGCPKARATLASRTCHPHLVRTQTPPRSFRDIVVDYMRHLLDTF